MSEPVDLLTLITEAIKKMPDRPSGTCYYSQTEKHYRTYWDTLSRTFGIKTDIETFIENAKSPDGHHENGLIYTVWEKIQ